MLPIQTLVIAKNPWNLSEEQIAEEYDLSLERDRQALLFYSEFREEIERAIATEETIERTGEKLLENHKYQCQSALALPHS